MAVTVVPATGSERENTLQDELALPILLTGRLLKSVGESEPTRPECAEFSRPANKLSHMLRTAVRLTSATSPSSIYDRPIRRIAADVAKNLERALTLVRKCKHTGLLRHVFLTTAADFRKVSNLLESSIADLEWLVAIFDVDEDGANLTLPPIANNDPILAWVWTSIASLHMNRKSNDRVESANRLATLARNECYRKVIVEEGGVPPLIRLLKDGGGSEEGQIAASMALICLVDERERSKAVVTKLGLGFPLIVQVLGKSSTRVQIAVAELVARVAEVDVTAREELGRENVLRPLLSCLLIGLDMQDQKRVRGGGKNSIHSIVENELAAKNGSLKIHGDSYHEVVQLSSSILDGSRGKHCSNKVVENELAAKNIRLNIHGDSFHKEVELGSSISDGRGSEHYSRKATRNEYPEVMHQLKTKCALALWRLCKGSVSNSQKIAMPKGLFCLSKIIENERGELQLYCLMTIMEVAEVAEGNPDLRRVAWKPSSPPAKAVLDQLLRVIKEESHPDIQIPSIKAIGCLARIFPAKETGIISTLVGQLGNMNISVATEATIALTKFICPDNHNCVAHSNSIIEFNGVPLVMKMLSAHDRAKVKGLVLLCYLSIHVANSKALAEARALRTLESAFHSGMAHTPDLKEILSKALLHLLLYQHGDHPLRHS